MGATHGDVLRSVAAELMADREVMLAAVAQDGRALEFAASELQADREFNIWGLKPHTDILLGPSAANLLLARGCWAYVPQRGELPGRMCSGPRLLLWRTQAPSSGCRPR